MCSGLGLMTTTLVNEESGNKIGKDLNTISKIKYKHNTALLYWVWWMLRFVTGCQISARPQANLGTAVFKGPNWHRLAAVHFSRTYLIRACFLKKVHLVGTFLSDLVGFGPFLVPF